VLFDPVHKISRSLIFSHNFVNLVVKKTCLVFLTTSLNAFQSLIFLDNLQFANFVWHSLFHHNLEYLVMLTQYENLCQMISDNLVYSWIISLRDSLLGIDKVSMVLITLIRLKVNLASSLLFLMIVCHLSWINSLVIEILTVRGAWLEG